jgi:hypothetical protein
MENPEAEIQAILERNKRVELDKAWEVSWFRRLIITALTYAGALLFIWSFTNDLLWWNAAVPAGAYLLSTLSLPWLKRWWMDYFYRNR